MTWCPILSSSNTTGGSNILTSLSQCIMSDPGLVKAAAAVSPAIAPHLFTEKKQNKLYCHINLICIV